MENDTTENARRQLVSELNAAPKGRAELEAEHGEVWDTDELPRDFDVKGFLAPFVVVRRKSDGVLYHRRTSASSSREQHSVCDLDGVLSSRRRVASP